MTTPPVNEYCRLAKPIRFHSKIDSPSTVAQIMEHDATYECVCNHDCPK